MNLNGCLVVILYQSTNLVACGEISADFTVQRMTRYARRGNKKSPLVATPWTALKKNGYMRFENEEEGIKIFVIKFSTLILPLSMILHTLFGCSF